MVEQSEAYRTTAGMKEKVGDYGQRAAAAAREAASRVAEVADGYRRKAGDFAQQHIGDVPGLTDTAKSIAAGAGKIGIVNRGAKFLQGHSRIAFAVAAVAPIAVGLGLVAKSRSRDKALEAEGEQSSWARRVAPKALGLAAAAVGIIFAVDKFKGGHKLEALLNTVIGVGKEVVGPHSERVQNFNLLPAALAGRAV